MELKIEYVDKESLKPYFHNAKLHPAEQVEQIKKSIEEFGFNDPIAIWGEDEIVEGHGRLLAVMEMSDITTVPVIRLDHLNDEQKRAYALVHNKLTMNSDFDMDLLYEELEAIDLDMAQFGFDTDTFDDVLASADIEKEKLQDTFIVPPFDIFNARGGAWNERKKYWKALINDHGQARQNARPFSTGKDLYGVKMDTETSILDPVLAEIVCRWFMPANGNCVDCFAGDTVFGYVCSYLGNNFTGIELRQEQCDFNNDATADMQATYICDDGQNILDHVGVNTQDLLFSCPPYYDLEVYSDLDNDASNQGTYEEFYKILDTAFKHAIQTLKDDRFAVIVVGDIRDKKGAYYNFPNDVINTFKKNGMILYNNIKLLTPIGTAAIRAARYMEHRKVAHVYQDVLVFYKGNPKNIKQIFPKVEVADVSEDMEL